MAVVVSLITKGINESQIKQIFQTYLIGEKYRSHRAPDSYLIHTINSAKNMSNLTEEERIDPLFISGSLRKSNNKYSLDIVKFEEYIVKKYKILILDGAIYKYNDYCYEEVSQDDLNYLCQKELSKHRKLFSKVMLKDFIHFAIGDILVDNSKAKDNQVRYLTLKNGLFDLEKESLIDHTPKIFTTNLLPYEYNPEAQCPRFVQFLDEVFLGDEKKIQFIQEAAGYGFHKAIPKPSLFFLTGTGSNGKSVFINTITSLFGEHNTSNISLSLLSNEYYILGLFDKMINVSSETPHKKKIDAELVKGAVAGDLVTGRDPYKRPLKFRPYAKHYLAMNKFPTIDDPTHGMWRRIYIIDFPKTFTEDEMDVSLTDTLKHELPGIFNWALDGYKRLREREFMFESTNTMIDLKNKYRNNTSSLFSFVSECFEKGSPEDGIKFGMAYDEYLKYCSREGFKDTLPKREFKDELLKEKFDVVNSKRHGNQLYVFGVNCKSISESI